MLLGKGVTGTHFQVLFKLNGPLTRPKGDACDKLPRAVLGCMGACSAGVMPNSFVQILPA